MSSRDSHVATISIHEAAIQTKLSAHTLRYYERIGLLPSIARDANGQRRYTADNLGAISILLTLRATGMPIGVMQRFVQLLCSRLGTVRLLKDVLCSRHISKQFVPTSGNSRQIWRQSQQKLIRTKVLKQQVRKLPVPFPHLE